MILENASTQYGDAKGTVSIDWHNGTEIHELAKFIGVPKTYFSLALSLSISSGDREIFYLTIYAAAKDEVGETADEIIQYSRLHDTIPVKEFRGEVTIADLTKYVKRFRVVATSHKLVGDAELEYDEG